MSKEEANFRVETFSKWEKFLSGAESLLFDHEAESNLIWEVGRVSAASAGSDYPWFGWVVMKGDQPLLAALPSVTGYLILSRGETGACSSLAAHLLSQSIGIEGVSGPEPLSSHFAKVWSEIMGETVTLGASLAFYRTQSKMALKSDIEGIFRLPRPEEEELLRGWAVDFGAESPRPMDPRALTRLSEQMLVRGDLFVWENAGQIVSMGGFGRETPNGLVINMIYTPRNLRGRGFAGSLTSGLVGEAYERGKGFCCLYSEFSSSVRRNLYERIGFELSGEFAEQSFGDQGERVPSERQ